MRSATKKLARERISILFERADAASRTNPKLSTRYVSIARKIAMSAKIRFPKEFKRRICRKCNSFFVYGENCRVRVRQRREPHMVFTCLSCGWQTRILLRKRKEEIGIEQVKDTNETPR